MNEYAVADTRNAWQRPPEVTDHSGRPLSDQSVFFIPPPPDLGKIITASSTLTIGKYPWPAPARFFLSTVPATVVGIVILRLRDEYFYIIPRLVAIAIALVLSALVLLMSRWIVAFRQECSYTGERGIARFRVSRDTLQKPKRDQLLFGQAKDLRVRLQEIYIRGFYAGSDFSYRWTGSNRKKLLNLSGKFRNRTGMPKLGHPYYFARAAETAWTSHLVRRMQNEIDETDWVQFGLRKGESIRVGPGRIELSLKNATHRIAVTQIKTFTISSGKFSIHHIDSSWLGLKGKWSFDYGKLANAQMFLLAIERYLGMRMEGGKNSEFQSVHI